jgi:hypothetical protein
MTGCRLSVRTFAAHIDVLRQRAAIRQLEQQQLQMRIEPLARLEGTSFA